MLPDTHDILVLGLGTAGAAAAAALAATGRSVHGLDALPLDRCGARWRNGVPGSVLAAHGIEDPGPPLCHPSTAFHMVAGWTGSSLTVRGHDLVDLDMPWLVEQLQDRAVRAGAVLDGGVRVRALEDLGDTVRVTLEDGQVLTARMVVDAAGLRAPSAARKVPREWICTAAQEDRALLDPEQASRWLQHHGLEPGETVSFAGVAGGFSIVNACVHLPHDDTPGGVSLLTGSIPGRGHDSGTVLLQRFVETHPWIGPTVSGGARAIPLVPPDPVIGSGRIARVGDAARQVYSMHGSGIAQGLNAAALLADVVANGGGPWHYNVRWQRTHGGDLAASAAFAGWSTGLQIADVEALIKAGLMHPALVRSGLAQRPPDEVDPGLLPALAAAALRAPRYASRMLPVIQGMRAVSRHHRSYPDDSAAVTAWVERRDSLVGLR